MANTGKVIYKRLKKVTDDGTNRPLDVNNVLTSVSGLPQATKLNIVGDPDYVAPVTNEELCPPLTGETLLKNIYVDMELNGSPGSFEIYGVLEGDPPPVEMTFTGTLAVRVNEDLEWVSKEGHANIYFPAGSLNGSGTGQIVGINELGKTDPSIYYINSVSPSGIMFQTSSFPIPIQLG